MDLSFSVTTQRKEERGQPNSFFDFERFRGVRNLSPKIYPLKSKVAWVLLMAWDLGPNKFVCQQEFYFYGIPQGSQMAITKFG